MAQETRILHKDCARVSRWAEQHGWKSILGPALRTEKGGTSAGVAIFAREEASLLFPSKDEEPAQVAPGRAVAGLLTVRGYRPIMVYAVYMISGGGLAEGNTELLSALGRHRSSHAHLSLLGGD